MRMSAIAELLRPGPKELLVLVLFVLIGPGLVQATQRLTPEERLIRLETKVDEGFKAVNQRIDDLDSKLSARIDDLDSKLSARIDDLRGIMLTGFGVLFSGMFLLVGFVIWDRRTALAPAIKKSKELEDREDRIQRVLKEFAREEPRLEEALRRTGLL